MYFEDQNLDLRQHSYIFAEKGYTPQPQRKVFGSIGRALLIGGAGRLLGADAPRT